MSTPLLELRNVTKVFQSGIRRTAAGTTVALRDASLVVPSDFATSTAVAGESGSGKTTMARLLLGFIKPTSGQIIYQGVDVAKMNRTQARQYRREVQPIFQDPFEVYNPFYKVDNVLTTPLRNFGLAADSKDVQRRMEEALEMVGLRPRETLGRYPHELSGGQRQRIMVARALMLRPKIIMADEPVSMVDASLRATILDELRKINTEFGISLLYITHDLTTAYQVCDNIVILYQGTVAEAGSVERVIRDPKHPYTQAPRLVDPADRPDEALGRGRGQGSRVVDRPGDRGLPLRAALPVRHGGVLGHDPAALPDQPGPGRVVLPLQGARSAAVRTDRRGLLPTRDGVRRLTEPRRSQSSAGAG